jgi:peptidyl-prolyl cis-trans isomerase C
VARLTISIMKPMKNFALLAIIISTVALVHADTPTTSSAVATPPAPSKTATAAVSTAKLPVGPMGLPPAAGATSAVVPLKDPVAIVDGTKISKEELEKAFKEALNASRVNPASLSAEQKTMAYRQILDGLIMEKLVDKKSANVQVTDADVNAEIEKIKKQFPSPDVFNAKLKESGQTMEQFTANLKKSKRQTDWIKSQIKGKDEVTDAEAEKFYKDNIKQFENPDMVKASHILFMVPPAPPEVITKDKEAMAKTAKAKEENAKIAKAKEEAAKAAIARANKGEDFSKLASELSEEPGAKQRGGDLGFFSKEQMVPEFSTAAFSQQVGTISQVPVKTKYGYHVIKVTDKKAAGTIPFAEAKQNIVAYLQNQKRRAAFKTFMQQLRQTAKIENTLPAPPPMPMMKPMAPNPATVKAATATVKASVGNAKTTATPGAATVAPVSVPPASPAK